MTERRQLPRVEGEGAQGFDRRVFLLASCGACAAACGAGGVLDAGETGTDAAALDTQSPSDGAAETGPGETGADASDATTDATDAAEAAVHCDEDGWSELGPVGNYPVGTHSVDTTLNLIITRDSTGIWAMRRTCNHQFGQIEARSSGDNRCTNTAGGASMHGATFDKDGVMIVPPGTPGAARFNLDNYAMRVCNGSVYVNPGMIVPAGTRAMFP